MEALPERTAVLDLVSFTRFEHDPQVKGKAGERRTPSYVGYVLARGRPVRQVDLGTAQPIDDAVHHWRSAIEHGLSSPGAGALRRLVWEPLAKLMPADTATVLIATDGLLNAVPWAALPGDKPGTVLLEQYSLATIPHAPFLLDRLTAPSPTTDDRGLFLAVGGVAYGQAPRPIEDEKTRIDQLAVRQAETRRGRGDGWVDLPGTLQELNAVARLAGPRTLVRLEGAEAGTARVLRELPRARWALIATHGFFADPGVPSVLRPDPRLFGFIGSERVGAGLRNPLVLSGLVLAGANRPGTDVDPSTRDDLGILTAESIAGLPLQDLELVVLSACESGAGTVDGGEGVFGLQRAFHLAGAHNVVASLWKVEDEATAALMSIFYDRLWKQNQPPIEAMRAAQLTLYHHPEMIGELTKARGTPDFDKVVQRPRCGERRCSGFLAERSGGGEAVGGVRPLGLGALTMRSIPNFRSLLLAIAGLGLIGADPPRSAPRPDDAEPLRGSIHLRIDDPTNPDRRNLRLDQPGALPLKAGDRFRIEVELNRPAYLYVFWLGADGKIAPIHPWAPGHWDRRPTKEAKHDRLDLPPKTDEAWTIPAGDPGLETLVLLARKDSPLPLDFDLCRLATGRPVPARPNFDTAIWIENGREVTLDPQNRAAPSSKTRKSDDPVLRIRKILQEKVQPLGSYSQAVLFPNRGGK